MRAMPMCNTETQQKNDEETGSEEHCFGENANDSPHKMELKKKKKQRHAIPKLLFHTSTTRNTLDMNVNTIKHAAINSPGFIRH